VLVALILKTAWLQRINYGRFLRVGREGLWILLGQVAAVIGSIAGVRLLTELLDPSTYGELALGMTVATLVGQLILGPLSNGATRFYAPAMEQNDLGGYLKAVRNLLFSATGVIVLLMLFAITGLLVAGQAKWIVLVIASLIFAVLNGYNSILNGVQNAARQRSIVALHQGMSSWARYLIAAGFLLWLGSTSSVAMIGYATAIILVLGSQYLFFRKIIFKNVSLTTQEKDWQVQIWNYSWPFAAWGVFSWIQFASDRWALELFTTTRDVGLYAVLYQLGHYPMSLITGMAMQLLAPIFYERAGDATDRQRNANVSSLSWRLAGFILGMICLAFLVALIFHTHIFRIFVAKDYAHVSYLLPWVLLSGGLFAAAQTITLNLMSQMKTQLLIAPKIIIALLGGILNFIGAYWYGIVGIIVAGISTSLFYLFWMVMLSLKNSNLYKYS
jgi:O-antigen/teichoic acid export membrane protein